MIKNQTNLENSLTELNQYISQLEELHPLDFRLAFGLTHEQAAYELYLEPQTMRAYCKNNPSRRVKKLAATIAKKWIAENAQPVNIQYLLNSRSS